MTDDVAPAPVVDNSVPAPKEGVVKKVGKGLLWLVRKAVEITGKYPGSALIVFIASHALRFVF